MHIKNKLRHWFHDVYYFFVSKRGIDFAMKCQAVAEQVDLKKSDATLVEKFRFQLHLSLCQSCKNYADTSYEIRKAVRTLIFKKNNKQVDKLNSELTRIYIKQRNENE